MNTIFMNGKIVTMDPLQPAAQAVAVKDGKFVKVGTNDEVSSFRNNRTEVIDLKGKMVVPGFIDSHMHLLSYGVSLKMADLNGIGSMDALIESIKKFIDEKFLIPGQWVLGRGWNHELFKTPRFPNRYDLDKISTEFPICLTRVCLHVCVVNSKALELAGVNKNTPQVEGGYFDVDENGEPLGIFRENAQYLIHNKIPQPREEEINHMITDASYLALKKGITSIHTDDFGALSGVDFQQIIHSYQTLVQNGQLPVRIYEQCLLPEMDMLKKFLALGYRTGQGNEFFKIGPLKLLGDGSLGARTAYLREPYSDDPNTRGIAVFTQQELGDLVLTAHNAGMQVAIHSIGDEIMAAALNSIEKAQKINPKTNGRHGIVHCQITNSELMDKFKAINAIAYVQPVFVCSDWQIVEKRVGKGRAKTSYNWKSLLNRGIPVAFGSDCPVEPFDVLPGIYAAVTRQDLHGFPQGGWLPEQKLSIDEALYGFTMAGAYASFDENIKGSISPGKLADMVVLSQDLYEIPSEEIKDVEVEMTFVGGKMMI